MNKKFATNTLALACALSLSPLALAEGIEFTGSGFLTIAAGKILGGTKDDPSLTPNGYKGPHYISDWAQGGVYEDDGLQMKPDTRLGLQGSVMFNPQLSVTGQVVGRSARNGNVDLEWLYGSYKVTDKLTLQVGRKRLPILYYSESQDVGVSYPWVHLPPDLYGWQVVNYNGANLMYQSQLGNWTYTGELFAGSETNRDTGYWKMYNGKYSKTDVRWTNILGADLTFSKDWFEARVGYIQNDTEQTDPTFGGYGPKSSQKIYTLGFVIDYGNWIIRNEYYVGDLSAVEEKDFSQIYAVGYHIGKFTPMFTYAKYYTRYQIGGPIYGYTHDDEERHDTRSFTLRYDLTTSSDIKLQYDAYRDRSGSNFATNSQVTPVALGNSRLISISYDKVF